jgi:hypothetical protein
MAAIAKVSELLGGPKVLGKLRNELDFVLLLRKGLPYEACLAPRNPEQVLI